MTGTGGGRVRWTRAGGGAAGLAAVGLLLLRAGAGSLSVPLHSAGELAAWLDVTAPPVVAMALVRLLALAVCGYLLVALAVAVGAELAPRRRVAVLVGQLAPVALRRAVVCGARSGLATGVALGWLGPVAGAVATGGPAAAATPRHGDPGPSTATMTHLDPTEPTPPAYATMVHLGPDPTTPPTPHPAEGLPGPVAPSAGAEPDPGDVSGLPEREREPDEVTTSSAAPDAAAVGAGTAVLAAPGAPGRPAPSTSPARQRPDGDSRHHDSDGGLHDNSWVVSPGDSFWSIAEETLRDARAGTQPDDAEISRYWRLLITANRDRLTAPDNPDLLTAGQVLLLPPV